MNVAGQFRGQISEWLNRLDVAMDGVVVAVSGGPDSIAMLHALVKLRVASTAPIVIAHLNHLLRGSESDDDEEFVKKVWRDLASAGVPNIRFRSHRIDVANESRKAGANLEGYARRIRYEWLTAVAQEEEVQFVATGHTADDQAETVLHRLLRGTGLKGLRGIAGRRPLAVNVELVRPLLHVTKKEVFEYLQCESQSFREDRTNLDVKLTRNRIRRQLLPHLSKRYNYAIVSILSRLAEQAAEVYEQTASDARALLTEAERPRAGSMLIFDRKRLAAARRSSVREAFRLAWSREGWPLDGMNFLAWDRLVAVARGELQAADFPNGIRARCRERVVQLQCGSYI